MANCLSNEYICYHTHLVVLIVTYPYQCFTQVVELETLGGHTLGDHALMLCAYDGVCYQGSTGIGESLLKTNIMETFARRLHCE